LLVTPKTPTQGGSQHDHHEDGPEGEAGPPTKRTQAKKGPADTTTQSESRGAPRRKRRGYRKETKNKQTDKPNPGITIPLTQV